MKPIDNEVGYTLDHAFSDISSILNENRKVWCIVTSKHEIKVLNEWIKIKYPESRVKVLFGEQDNTIVD